METRGERGRHGEREMETRGERDGDTGRERWRHGEREMEVWGEREGDTGRERDGDTGREMETRGERKKETQGERGGEGVGLHLSLAVARSTRSVRQSLLSLKRLISLASSVVRSSAATPSAKHFCQSIDKINT